MVHPAWQREHTARAVQRQEEGRLRSPGDLELLVLPGDVSTASWHQVNTSDAAQTPQAVPDGSPLLPHTIICPGTCCVTTGLCHIPSAGSIPGSRGMCLQGWDTVCAEYLHRVPSRRPNHPPPPANHYGAISALNNS